MTRVRERDRPRALWLRLSWLLALSLQLGCAASTVSLAQGPRAFTPDDYEDVYAEWTREREYFRWSQFEDTLNVTATFESWEFRWAYVVRYAEDQGLEGEAREALLRTSLADTHERHRFFITLGGRIYREQELSSPNSAWRLMLVDPDGRTTTPVEILRVRRPTPAERVYFPSINSFRYTYRVVFPATHEDGTPTIPAGATEVILRLTGPRGRVDLRWELETTDAS